MTQPLHEASCFDILKINFLISCITFQSVTSSEQSDGPITLEEYLEVKKELAESRAKVQQIQQINKDLRQEINILQSEVKNIKIVTQFLDYDVI